MSRRVLFASSVALVLGLLVAAGPASARDRNRIVINVDPAYLGIGAFYGQDRRRYDDRYRYDRYRHDDRYRNGDRYRYDSDYRYENHYRNDNRYRDGYLRGSRDGYRSSRWGSPRYGWSPAYGYRSYDDCDGDRRRDWPRRW